VDEYGLARPLDRWMYHPAGEYIYTSSRGFSRFFSLQLCLGRPAIFSWNGHCGNPFERNAPGISLSDGNSSFGFSVRNLMVVFSTLPL